MRNRWLTKYKSLAICGLVSSLLTLPSLTFGRGTFNGGGGGYGVRCSFDNGVSYQLYALDYLQTDGMTTLDPKIVSAKSAEEIISIIHKGLDRTLPMMAESLKDFMKSMKRNFNDALEDPNEKRLWLPGTNPLGFLNDAAALRDLQHCKIDNGRLDLYQAVIREVSPDEIADSGDHGTIHYSKDEKIIQELAQTNPMQVSFTYIHEWLRDYTDSPSTIQKANRYLHSVDWEKITGLELHSRLRRLHLILRNQVTRQYLDEQAAAARKREQALQRERNETDKRTSQFAREEIGSTFDKYRVTLDQVDKSPCITKSSIETLHHLDLMAGGFILVLNESKEMPKKQLNSFRTEYQSLSARHQQQIGKRRCD